MKRKLAAGALIAGIASLWLAMAEANSIKADAKKAVHAAFDIVETTIVTKDDMTVFTTRLRGDAGSEKPEPTGKFDGSDVYAYVWQTCSTAALKPPWRLLSLPSGFRRRSQQQEEPRHLDRARQGRKLRRWPQGRRHTGRRRAEGSADLAERAAADRQSGLCNGSEGRCGRSLDPADGTRRYRRHLLRQRDRRPEGQ
jgi:hypothetical protein